MTAEVLTSDVLVIGGGHAAIRAAIEAARQGVNVLLVDKGQPGRSSISAGDGGGAFAFIRIPEELGGDPAVPHDAVLRDAVEGGEYLNRQEMTRIYCDEAIDRFQDLVGWGVQFHRHPDGGYKATRFMGESYAYGFGLANGPDGIFARLIPEIEKLGITQLSNVMVTKILTRNNQVVGAFGLDRVWGKHVIVKAKATIVAAGGMTGLLKHTSAYTPCTGDSFALAYNAGARLGNMEITGFSVVPTPLGISISMGSTMPMTAFGARWYNALGERIMERYDPQRLELAVEWKMPYANYKERLDGRGPVYVDLMYMRGPKRGIIERIKRYADVDPERERVEMSVSLRTSPGGIWINERAETSLRGLYAAGDASGEAGTRGAGGRSGGFTNAHVFGRRAGYYAAEATKDTELLEPELEQIAAEEARIDEFKRREGRSPLDVERKLREFAFENLNAIRNQRGLEQAIGYFVAMRNEGIHQIGAANLQQLVKALEVSNMAITGEMVARAALMRTESRGFHQRSDYPERNDREWLKWILIEKDDDGEMKLSTQSIPINQYSLKP